MTDTDTNQQGPIVGFTRPKRFLFFKIKSRPIYQGTQLSRQTAQPLQPTAKPFAPIPGIVPGKAKADQKDDKVKFSKIDIYLDNLVAKHKGLDVQLREQGIKGSPQQFAKKMMSNAIMIATVVGVALAVLLYKLLSAVTAQPALVAILIGGVSALASYNMLFRQFLNYPAMKAKARGKEVERGILFAARDIIISLRSGVPLFNALTSVSSGYGATSTEFAKIINLIQLGMPMDQAIDQVSASSSSKTFKRIMLQASVSIRQGADVVLALQEVVDQATQERTIELRRYGQRLNALSMFYMLFGVILPSMGIAVLSILTTFINIFTVTTTLLVIALIFIGMIQFVFFTIMKNSRPLFTL